MPHLPYLKPRAQTRLTTERFLGLDRRESPPDGAWARCENLSLRSFPALAPRAPRGTVAKLSHPGGLCAKDALCWVENGTLYVGGAPTPVTGLAERERQLVSMGAYLILWPDRMYYNTADPTDYGSLDADWRYSGTVHCSLCRADGSAYDSAPTVSSSEPEGAENLALWIDSSGEKPTLKQYSASLSVWVVVEQVFTKLRFTTQGQIPALFSALDGVTVSGAPLAGLNGEKLLYALGGAAGKEADYIVLEGLCQTERSYENCSLHLRRRAPEMDFLCECGNRLWGCFYGNDGAQNLNEIYACALGDFKNWRQYLGLSTDSWTASVGSDGPWTGAVSYLGSPVFFKADRLHRVSISSAGAHRLTETVCRGVQKGSHKSLAVVGETLYYKSPSDVCAWQGGFPESVSAALGESRLDSAVGGAQGAYYYLSARGGDGKWELLVYDTARALWLREDSLHVLAFAGDGDELYALDAGSGAVLSLTGRSGTAGEAVNWWAESPPLHYATPDHKYPGRMDLRLRLGPGARLRVLLSYDGAEDWQLAGTAEAPAEGAPRVLRLPVRPRRCDSYRLRLEGTGDSRLLAWTRVLETGSDL